MTIDVSTAAAIAQTIGRVAGLFGGGGGPAIGTGHVARGYIDATGFHGTLFGQSRNSEETFEWPEVWDGFRKAATDALLPVYRQLFGANATQRVNLTAFVSTPAAGPIVPALVQALQRQAPTMPTTQQSLTSPPAGALTAAITNSTPPASTSTSAPPAPMMAGMWNGAGLALAAVVAWALLSEDE